MKVKNNFNLKYWKYKHIPFSNNYNNYTCKLEVNKEITVIYKDIRRREMKEYRERGREII